MGLEHTAGHLSSHSRTTAARDATSRQVCFGVHKATRQAAAIDIGDEVSVEIERDNRPRTLDIPADLARALADDATAQTVFDRLSFTHRREYVEALTGARRAETRSRRLSKILDDLRGSSSN
ncbi:MAG TPA: YdeI/OmpD-associated family protein [Jatrophihabitantaceae bacterium]|nr:YdeI/OmpD-associated family protein [Jatrophihabitantaceae bacterium]